MPAQLTDSGAAVQTAESVTKLLRDPSQNSSQKLDFASTLWHGNDTFIPGKEELLLEWMSSELFSGTKSKDGKSLPAIGERAHLSKQHWALFAEIINRFASAKTRQERTGSSVWKRSSRAPTVAIRTYAVKARVMDVFTTLLDDLCVLLSDKAVPLNATNEIMELAEISYSCLCTLASTLPEVLRPTLELYISMAISASRFFITCTKLSIDGTGVLIATQFLKIALSHLAKMASQYPNQKKIFTLTITKLLTEFMILRQSLLVLSPTVFPRDQREQLLDLLRSLLKHGLFHKEHISDFAAVLHLLSEEQSDVQPEKLGYPKQFFDYLRSSLATANAEQVSAVLTDLPFLFELFIESCSVHFSARSTSQSPTFGFFHEVYKILAEYIPATKTSTSQDSTKAQQCITTIVNLLEKCHMHDVYRATNDAESKKQLQFYEQVNRTFLDLAAGLSGKHYDELIRGWRTLLLLDHTIIEAHLTELWSFTILPSPEAYDHSVALCCELVRIFTKSRQLDALLESWLRFIRERHIDQNMDAAEKVTFCAAQCQEELTRSVAALLPAQAVVIMQALYSVLTEHYLPIVQPEPAKKKRKTSKADSNRVTVAEISSQQPSAEIPSLLFCIVLQHSHISEGQRIAVNKLVNDLHSAFIQPILSLADNHSSNLDTVLADSLLCPALLMQLVLLKHSPAYWTNNIKTDGVLKMMNNLSCAHVGHAKIAYLKNEIALCHIDRVASTTIDPLAVPGCSELARGILKSFTETPQEFGVTWDSRVSAITKINAHVATWTSVVNHLPAITRLAGPDELRSVVDILVSSLEYDGKVKRADGDVVVHQTMSSVSAQLLMSATFYELRNIRDVLVPEILRRISKLFEPDERLADNLHEDVSAITSTLSGAAVESESECQRRMLAVFETPDKFTKIKVKSSVMKKCLCFLEIFNTLPAAYFRSNERECMVRLVTLLELISFRSLVMSADSKKNTIGLRCGITCRTLCYRFMRSREDKVLTLVPPGALRWLLSSLETYAERETGLSTLKDRRTLSDVTFLMEHFIIHKAWQRFSTASNLTSANYFDSILHEINSTGDPCTRLEMIVHFLRPTIEWFESKRKRLSKEDEAGKVAIAADIDAAETIVNKFLSQIEESVMAHLRTFANAGIDAMDTGITGTLDEKDCERGLAAFKVFQLMLSHYKAQGSDRVAEFLDLLAAFVGGSIRMLIESSVELNMTPTIRSALSLLSANFLATFAANIRDIHPAVDPSALRNLGQLIGYIMDTTPQKESEDAISASGMAEVAMKCLVRDCSKPQYLDLIAYQLDALEKAPAEWAAASVLFGPSDHSINDRTPSLIKVVDIIVMGDNREVGRTIVRRVLPNVLVKLGQVVQVTTSLGCVLDILHLLTSIASDKFLALRHSDVGLIFTCIVAALSSASRLMASLPIVNLDNGESVPAQALELFDTVYRLLLAVLRYRKELVVHEIASLGVIIKDLLVCFRVRTRMVGPRLTRASAPPTKTASGSAAVHVEPLPLLAQYSPLPAESAAKLSRILVAFSQKSGPSTHGDSASAALEATSTPSAAAITTSSSATVKPFTKHAPFILSTILHIQCSTRPFTPEAKHELMEGIYTLLDLCGEHGREAVLAASDPHGGGRPLLKAMVADWEMYHRYTGKV
ncbi:Urb2/Npa2 family-domain-containing protein [Powellomyces hirtus]|nr:Urb2/Npa2 family-domain-containing protein [Powellomyces hirtus]